MVVKEERCIKIRKNKSLPGKGNLSGHDKQERGSLKIG